MTRQETLLELVHITKCYGTPSEGPALQVLDGIDLCIPTGDSVAIQGPSGSGKSTLLNIIGTLDRPTSGSVLLNKRNIVELPDSETSRIRNSEIGFVFQDHHLLPQCSILENVLMPTIAQPSMTRNEPSDIRAHRLLKRVGLESRLHHRPGELSGGERQRTAVVRALINEPGLLLADEPTGSLDADNAESLGDLLMDLNREESIAMIVVTHSMELSRRMNRVMQLRAGRLAGGEA